ncbi:adhesion G protein-coupled receptor A1 isoform X1 [Mixophyes fleayi]|uniref:adhesion G protein-coupled receptor A1 isoform X1 n=2 Tax=Mixophyes fleayi TaxID=3061075 RepID=UPI003F4E0374
MDHTQLLLLCYYLVLSLAGSLHASSNCPDLITDSCLCEVERSKGLGRQKLIHIKVVCSGGELVETLQPTLLPNKTISLILSNNKISLVKNRSFLGLKSLEKLDLRNNLISTIEPGAFYGLSELRRLDLSNNRIGCLSSDMFLGLHNLHKLNLSGNIFSTLGPGLFKELSSLKVIFFSTESLICDCNLKWILKWAVVSSIRISEDTICGHPSTVRGLAIRTLQENQLTCDGPLELPLFQIIPSQKQIVFHGDRLPFHCTATYMPGTRDISWLHDGQLIETDEERGIFVEESIIHDCCLITRDLILSSVDMEASGVWECQVNTSYGSISKQIEIVVLETGAPYCPMERTINNRGEYRWPRTLAGMTAFHPCRQFPLSSLLISEGEEQRAWRKCDRTGHWAEEDYIACPFAHEVTRQLHAFSLVPVNHTNALEYAQQLMAYTRGASDFTDKMDVLLVAVMMETLISFVGQIRQLGSIMIEIASNIMSVDDHILWMAQNETKACTRIVRCVEQISGLSLNSEIPVLSKVSLNIALESVLIKPASFIGTTCVAYQRTSAHSERSLIHGNEDVDSENIQNHNLILKCSSGSLSGSLLNVSAKNTVAVASIHLPQSAFAQSPSLQSVDNSSCKLQLIVFRNGKLFPITGNTSYLADQGKRRAVATPALLSKIDGYNFGILTHPLTIALRHFTRGVDPIAAFWDFDLLDGHGGWCGEGCHIITSAGNITTIQCTHFGNFAVLMDLKTVLSLPQYPGEFLHPVVYACTAVMLLCLFASIVTYIVHHSTIRISRKGWHMLLNFCFHTSLTFAVFAGGINRTSYPIICQTVGIVLHYSSLCTVLWIGVTARNIYKQVTKNPAPIQNGDQPPFPKQPMLRLYLISGGVPFIICGITAAISIKNYGQNEENAPYCWMAWEPSLGAFYGPVAFIVLVTCIYFLCTYVQLKRHPERKYELKERTEEQQRLAGAEMGHSHISEAGPVAQASCSLISSSLLENEHSFKAQLRAAAFTLFLFTATWTFGALAVSQGHFLDMIFSCLYGAFCVTLGLFTLIHHCAKRDDVWHCWWSCCPSKRNAYAVSARQKVNINGDAQGHATCIQDSPCPNKSPMYNHPSIGHCKLTNLQAVQNHVNCLSPVTPCCAKIHCEQLMEDEAHIHVHNEGAFRPNMHVHRCLKSRTKPRYFSRHRSAAEREYAYHIPSSIDGSIHSSHTDSPHSTHEGHTGHRRGCCAASDPYPTISQPESSDASTAIFSCGKMPDSDTVPHTHFEMQPRRQSFPFNTTNPNGVLKGSMHEAMVYSSDNTGNIKTGPWRNETTV